MGENQTSRGKKGGNTVRIPIVAKLDSNDDRERYLAHVLRHGIYVDEKKVQFLKGSQLLEYLAFLSLSAIDKDYLTVPSDNVSEEKIAKSEEKKAHNEPQSQESKKSQKRNVIKVTAENLKDILI